MGIWNSDCAGPLEILIGQEILNIGSVILEKNKKKAHKVIKSNLGLH